MLGFTSGKIFNCKIMDDLKLKILSKLKDVKLAKFVYPSISGLFIITALALFVFSANFISKHINKALSDGDVSGGLLSLNKDGFEPIKKKLNIKIEENVAPQETAPVLNNENASTTEVSSASSTPPEATKVEITPEEKLALKISVLNSTKTSGLAAGLKKILEESGFVVGKTGNTSPVLTETVIKIKKGKEKYKDSIVSAISAKYSVNGFPELPENDPYDIVIIIGK